MDVNEDIISEYLTVRKVRFIIPVYQRNYDWRDEQCQQLWDDVLALSENADKKKTHFIGTICSKSPNNTHERTIIDGQQRITTISLLVKAIHDVLEDEGDKTELDESYLHNTGKGIDPENSIKLVLNKHDNQIYTKLLGLDNPIESNFDPAEQNSRIYKNYFFFLYKLKELTIKEIEAVWDAFDRLNLIDLQIGDENPQEIFESLNSTGLELKNVDLIRNNLLMNLGYKDQVQMYNHYWSKIEENVGTDNMDRFFVDYLIYTRQSDSLTEVGVKRRQHINENTLYCAFKNHYAEVVKENPELTAVEKIESILKDMHECSIVYKELVFEDEMKPVKSGETNPSVRIPWLIYSIVNLNQSVSARPLLLLILTKEKQGIITAEQALAMINGCLSYVFRSKICRFYGLTGQSSGNIIKRIEESNADPLTAFWKAITSGTGKYAFPSDELFKNELMNRDVYLALRANGCRYLLYTLEYNYVNSKGVDDVYPWESSTEHILPQTPSEAWKAYLGDEASRYLEYVHRLGNLTLTDYNSSMSNQDFDSKKKWFQTARYAYTTKLCDVEKWNIAAIETRGSTLAGECLKIWILPKEYQNGTPQEAINKRKALFRFTMVDIEPGSFITFANDPSIKAKVLDDRYVEYEGIRYSLSSLACKLLGGKRVNAPSLFMYRGKSLNDLRTEYEEEQAFDDSFQATLDDTYDE